MRPEALEQQTLDEWVHDGSLRYDILMSLMVVASAVGVSCEKVRTVEGSVSVSKS